MKTVIVMILTTLLTLPLGHVQAHGNHRHSSSVDEGALALAIILGTAIHLHADDRGRRHHHYAPHHHHGGHSGDLYWLDELGREYDRGRGRCNRHCR